MKQAFFKDIRRTIWKQKVSFISIIVISMLAVTAFLGINYSADAMRANAAGFYKELNFRDFEIAATLLMDQEDLNALKELEGVADAEGVLFVDVRIENNVNYEKASVVSLTERINTISLQSGRLPETAEECVLEEELMKGLNLKIGDSFTVIGEDGQEPSYLKSNRFTITGTALHPDHYAKSGYVPGNRYILVNKDAFDEEALEGHMMKAEIVMDKPEGMGVFDPGYKESGAALKEKLDPIAKEREAQRTAVVRQQGEEKLQDAEAELADAKQQLDDGRKQLDDGAQQLRDAEAAAADGKVQLDNGKAQLDDALAQLLAGQGQLDAGRAELDSAKAQLDASGAELAGGFCDIEDIKAMGVDLLRDVITEHVGAEMAGRIGWSVPNTTPDLMDPSLTPRFYSVTDTYAENLEDSIATPLMNAIGPILAPLGLEKETPAVAQKLADRPELVLVEGMFQGFVAGNLPVWESGHAQYLEGMNQYLAGEAAYAANLAQYQNGWAQYEAGMAEYQQMYAQYEDGLRQIETARADLAQGEEDYAKGLSDYQDALEEYEQGKKDLEGLPPCRWVVLGVSGNGGYIHARDSADNIAKLGITFALMFVVIGALVIYVTVGRIIEENRRLVGTQKALGFFSSEVRNKYLTFGVTATAIGAILGTVLQHFLVQPIVLNVHNAFYITDTIPKCFRIGLFLITLAAGIILAGLAVWVACRRLLKETAKALMAAQAPERESKSEAARSSGRSLYSRLILRNMGNDKGRIFVTIVSIAGCCVLLMIGFTLNTNIKATVSTQFSRYITYDEEVTFDTVFAENVKSEVENTIKEAGADYLETDTSLRAVIVDDEYDSFQLLVPKGSKVTPFFHLMDRETGEELDLPESGIIFPSRSADAFHLSVGDSITLYDEYMNPHEAKIAGIAKMYYSRHIFLSEAAYREIFAKEPQVNSYYYNCKDEKKTDALGKQLKDIHGVDEVYRLSEVANNFMTIASGLTGATMILIIAAAVMAYFILMNLVSMYLAKKKLELTVMRINGYTSQEVIRYCLIESVFTTAAGILLGLVGGAALASLIIFFLQQPHMGFDLSVSWIAVGLSTVITAVFSVVIHVIALQKIRKLSLTDIE